MKKITLDCYTYRPEVYEYAKISNSSNFYPDWWKSLPASKCPVTGMTGSEKTMKSCPGFTNLFKSSYTLPLWSDLHLETDASGNWAYQFSDCQSDLASHTRSQYEGFMEGYQHFKLHSPWFAVCNKPIQWAFMAPSWHPIKGIHIVSGMVDYYYQHNTNINLFTDKPIDTILPFGTPLAHLIPITEEKIELKHHLVSKEEWEKLNTPTLTFTRVYYNMRRLINERNSK